MGQGHHWRQVSGKLESLAPVLLAVGLLVAIATDGALPIPASKALFAVLMALNLVTVRRLLRSFAH